jgi:hypothetical protein
MRVACGVGVVIAVGEVRVVFGGCLRDGAVGGGRPQRAAVGGMSNIREKTDKLSCCSAFHSTPPHCTNNFRKHFNSMPGSGVAEMVLTK